MAMNLDRCGTCRHLNARGLVRCIHCRSKLAEAGDLVAAVPSFERRTLTVPTSENWWRLRFGRRADHRGR